MKNKYRFLFFAEILILLAFLLIGFVVVQNSMFSAKSQFADDIDELIDQKHFLQRLNGLEEPETILQDLSFELERIPYEKTLVVVNAEGVIAALSTDFDFGNHEAHISEKKIQDFIRAAERALLVSDFDMPHWVKSTEKNTAIRFDYYFLLNGKPTILFVEFTFFPFRSAFLDDNFLFLFVETIVIFLFVQLAAFVFCYEYFKKKEQLEKSHSYFVNGVAHEIKTPISEIINLTECAAVVESLPAKEKYLKKISECAENMNATVDLFLRNSSYLSGRKLAKAKMSLSDTVRSKVSEFSSFYNEKGIQIDTDFTEPLSIIADQQLIAIVIDNFLSNALKYTKRGGSVRIRTYCRGKKAGFAVYNQTDLPVNCKTIWDSAYAPDSGTGRIHGVGLNLSKKILRLHRFHYGCRKEAGGVYFYFETKIKSS